MYRCVCLKRTRRFPEKCPIYSRFRLTRAQFQSTCTDSSPEKRPVYDGFQFKSVRFNQTHLYKRNSISTGPTVYVSVHNPSDAVLLCWPTHRIDHPINYYYYYQIFICGIELSKKIVFDFENRITDRNCVRRRLVSGSLISL